MPVIAAVLSLLLAAQAETPKTDPALQREIGAFVGHVKAARLAEAYAYMSPAAQRAFGFAQFAAYVASRKRALGALVEVANIRVAPIVEKENNMTFYEADVRFEKGTSPAWFVLTREDAGWRIQKFGFDLPEGQSAPYDAGEMLPILQEMLALVKREGAPALAHRFSEKDLAEVEQTPESARAAMVLMDTLLGPLESYTLGKPEHNDETKCSDVQVEGKFRDGAAPLKTRLCWADGVWRLRHAEITPMLNPVILERTIEYAFQGQITAKCPRDAALPIGGEIVCRLTPKGEPAQDATIVRTTESGWKITALAAAKD